MASELEDKDGDRKKQRLDPAASAHANVPAGKGEVTPEVARVVNLLQRLDKLHSKSLANESLATNALANEQLAKSPTNVPPPLPRGDHAKSDHAKSDHARPNQGGLSSLSDRHGNHAGLRAVPSAPIAFAPQPFPPVRASIDLPSVLQGPLPVRNDAGTPSPVRPMPSAANPPVASDNPAGQAVKHQRDNPPVVLICSVIIGLVMLGGLGLYQFQRGSPVTQRDPAVSNSSINQARADAAASLAPAKTADPVSATCAASLTGTEHGVVTLAVSDPSRAGQTATIAIDDLSYRAAFDAKGALRFDAPLFAQQGVVSWDRPNATPCEKRVVMPKASGMLRVALVSSGDVALDLHVIEPNAWFGGPSGHISNLNRNEDQSRGAGRVQTFGDGFGAARTVVYTIDAARIAPGGVLNAFVNPSASDTKGSAACTQDAQKGEEPKVEYQVLILRTSPQSDDVQRETKAFSMGISPCGANAGGGRSERIIVRN